MMESFPFENSDWPALLVEETGMIRHSNKAAVGIFGPAIKTQSTPFSTIWSVENEMPAAKFLASPDRNVGSSMLLKFKAKTGDAAYRTLISPVSSDGTRHFLFQLLSDVVPSKPETGAFDANLAHKQKLDCALQLARTVALDFNNALTSVLGHASLLLSKADSDHPWRTSLVEIEKSASKAAEIAADLAAFSRQEKDAKAQTSGNLNELLQRIIELFQKPELAGLEWILHLEPKLFTAKFDEAKLQQALVKVLENALEAVDERGHITVETRNLELAEPTQDRTVKLSPGTYVCIEISDNGAGIPAEVLPRIFEPFFTTKSKPHRGLGLAFAYGIITNHGGGIAISSEPGLGASARIYLPATKRYVKQERTVDPNELFGVETILMVDDEDLLLTMGQAVLSSFGYQVLTANSGQRALEILQNGDPIDLVITDLVMPHMSGRELIEHIREVSPEMRILCTSGYVRGQMADEESSYLQKPFTSQELLRKVKQTLS